METIKNLVLIVDDVEQNVAVLSQVLRNSGYNVMAAFSGEAALRMVEKRLPDLILLDVMMPGMDGFQTCEKLKENEATKDIPIIFLSALSETDTKVKGLRSGGVDYISKPFQEAEVVARVQVHLKIKNLETERLRHISQLQELNEEKDRLVQIVSHDLRSPLGGIMGLSSILTSGEESGNVDTVKYFSKIIHDTSESLINLVNDILDVAKIESGNVTLEPKVFDLVSSVESTISLQKYVAQSKGIELRLCFDNKPMWVRADKPKLLQVFSNLISNAIKFTKEGEVVLSILSNLDREHSNIVTVEISDSGIGIPEENLSMIFEKFGKHQRKGTNGEKGTGLGMPIVKRFVELHGGTINIRSTVNKGTTFTIDLPISTSEVPTMVDLELIQE